MRRAQGSLDAIRCRSTSEEKAQIPITLRQWNHFLPQRDSEDEIFDTGHTPRVLLAMDSSEDATAWNWEHHHARSALIACIRRHVMSERVVQNDIFKRASGLEP